VARSFELPDLGEGIHEAEIREVLVSPGDEVQEGQDVLMVETDKAVVEVPSPYSGVVQEIRVERDQLVHVGDVLLTFDGEGGEAGAEAEAREAPEKAPEPAPKKEEKAAPEKEERAAKEKAPAAGQPAGRRTGPIPASPATRRLARELGVELSEVEPSGPGGRVTAEDVRAAAEKGAPAPQPAAERPARAPAERPTVRPSEVVVPPLPDFSQWGRVERQPLRSVRRATAQHMALSWSQIPHVTHQDVVDVTETERFRQRYRGEIEEQGGRLTLTVFAMKAVAAALKAHPRFNASLDAETQEIVIKHYYHLGIAVDTDRGLIVPVIRDVDRKSMTELAIELTDLAGRTRNEEATLEDLQGGTFTITNIGILGGTSFAPVINYPEVAILGMARARWQPVVRWNGKEGESTYEIEPRYILPLMLTFDHRVVDGADAARFMNLVVEALEKPEKMLLML
jgi:pyruvate dehydrogenase E2 component (dihydrolipoamide acetyltransferase)